MNKPQQTSRASWVTWLVFFIPVVWAAIIAAQSWESDLAVTLANLTDALNNPLALRWMDTTPKFIALFVFAYIMGIGIYHSTKRNRRPREEHGSAKWGEVRAIARKYRSGNPHDDVILTQNFRIGLDGRKHRRNLNVLVVGGSGAGKTRFYAKPNIMQMNCSYIITDPKGEILRDTGNLLKQRGYEIKVFDLINPEASDKYNPFLYVKDDKDVLKLIANLIKNTTPKGSAPHEPFWEKSETALLQALILYLIHETPPEEHNFATVLKMLSFAEVRKDEDGEQSPLDILFEQLEMEKPEHIACKQYHIFKQAVGETASSILVCVGVRLSAFNIQQISDLTSVDEIDLAALGRRKTAVFCLIPDNDTSLNYLVGMLYTQAFQTLYYVADRECGGRLPVHVHCVMDEWANVSLPDDFEKILSTMRSREISVSIIVQNISQIKALFKDSHESIIGNCDSLLYLGGNESSAHEYVSKLLGKETLDTNTYGYNRGRNGSYTTNYQQSGRELLTPDEIRMLDNDYALLFVRGERPVMDKKYDVTRHPNIRLTTDGSGEPYVHSKSNLMEVNLNETK